MIENTIKDRDGNIVKRQFIWYSAPTTPAMAAALAENLRRAGASFRIMTEDGAGIVVDQWLRPGFVPDDGRDKEI